MEQGLQPLWRNDSQQVTSPSTTTLAADIPAHLKSQNDVKRTLTSLEQKAIIVPASSSRPYGATASAVVANPLVPRAEALGP